jgi:hypothetical protein
MRSMGLIATPSALRARCSGWQADSSMVDDKVLEMNHFQAPEH